MLLQVAPCLLSLTECRGFGSCLQASSSNAGPVASPKPEVRSRRTKVGGSGMLAAGKPKPKPKPKKNVKLDISTHRAVVVVRLLRIEYGGAFADVLSGNGDASWEEEMKYVEKSLGFRTRALTPDDMKLVSEETAGVIRWKRYLDFVISSVYDKGPREFDRMEPTLLMIFRLGVYELLKLDMPAYAVVDEAVKLATEALRPGAGGFVNALLRSVSVHKERGTLPVLEVAGDDRSQARALATIHSHPVWIVRRWLSRYGMKEATELMEYNNTRPVYAMRANSARRVSRDDLMRELTKLGVACTESSYLADFVRLSTGMQEVLRAGLVGRGKCTVQDESAGLVVAVLDPQPGDVVIDCCAAPGGKSLYIAARLKGKGKVIAVDINKARLGVLQEAARTAGVSKQVSVYHVDARNMTSAEPGVALADKVLLDAPCSGLGVLSKRADLRWRRSLETIKELVELQDELLEGASKMVREGGYLVYSTCSIEPEENAQRVETFLNKNQVTNCSTDEHLTVEQNFVLESVGSSVPATMVSSEGYFNSLPFRDSIDGAFAARMRRVS